MHPNQLALPVAVTRWVEQSQQLDDATAIERLDGKLTLICDALNILASDADEVPPEIEGLSVVDLMSAQSSIAAEIGTRRRLMAMGIAA
ncbi:hypothetical protein [Brevundimonas olei]|uniref:hypothetical protein n=1 Tax=Brevundimonas olei TaxID=657642 RepID=UPI0031D69F6F